MGHDSDSEDYICVGTPIERELEAGAGSRRAPAGDGGATRSLPVHKQSAVDEEGRRRFHGAFTGGFSAGYYNTVGSKEGWAPSSFKSSRSARAEAAARTAEDYMDEDEKAEKAERALAPKARPRRSPSLTGAYFTLILCMQRKIH